MSLGIVANSLHGEDDLWPYLRQPIQHTLQGEVLLYLAQPHPL